MPIEFSTVTAPEEVEQILALQALNHYSALQPAQILEQGFVTVKHDPGVLHRMNQVYPSAIAKDGGTVVGYALMMPRSFGDQIPVLVPMFELLDTLSWQGKRLKDEYRWFAMGQICVAEGYRGVGIFDGLYANLSSHYANSFDLIITEIAARNTRSIRAHERVGFQTLHVYTDKETQEVWSVVVFEMNKIE